MKPCWGLISEDFPAVRDQVESCKRTESRKKEDGDGNSKFWAAQRSETFEERENRLNKELKEVMMKKYSSVFVEKLGEEDRILDVEAEIELKDDEDIKPVFTSTARVIPKHYQEPAKELVKDLLAANL